MVDNAYNVTTQVRQIILGIDPFRADTLIQDTTMKDLDLDSFNDIIKFSQSYNTLAANTGRAFTGPELTKKWFSKLIKPLGDWICKAWLE